ncbi:beta-ribofuranosylaminobenzene 5'-phosphate synthase [Pyrofollis japonicus]|uniref:hypothetical protein n=1 Tax=Pyrofollis japonicus TaxID=3060460 RepID=UPI00295AF267|nr:hypothetical protein [Pyrofollis japonicus]BEP18705.1 beta-ribofuranosylaminobenzene 5'-phosphate synthase [Pyrofollis japonicus]
MNHAWDCVEVVTAARLHLGFYNSYNPRTGTAYGSVGVAIEKPRLRVRLCKRGANNIPHDLLKEAEFLRARGMLAESIGVLVDEYIPRHVGFGSTTQTLLSLGLASSLLEDRYPSIYELALRLGRGFVSGIGIESFRRGGLIVDSGRPAIGGVVEPPRRVEDLPRAIARIEVSPKICFIVITPRAVTGLPESPSERQILRAPRPLPKALGARLAEAVRDLLISGIRGDAEAFGEAVTILDEASGTMFSDAQGSTYCCGEVAAGISALRRAGALGWGQSSWGPTFYGVQWCDEAEKVLEKAMKLLKNYGVKADGFVTRVRNSGAKIRVCK